MVHPESVESRTLHIADLPQIGRTRSLVDAAAQTLLRAIMEQRLSPGDRLPPEKDLGALFGVSRTVIREAVRVLVAKGVVAVRNGTGLEVAAVGPGQVRESMHLYLMGRGEIDYAMLHEVRTTIEIRVAVLAADRATRENVAEMKLTCDQMESRLDEIDSASAADVAFHRALAASTHNDLYSLILDSLQEPLIDVRLNTLGLPEHAAKALSDHRRILAAVERRDGPAAEAAMRAHLDFSVNSWHEATSSGESV